MLQLIKKKSNTENDYRYIEILILVLKNRKYAEWIWFLFCKLTSSSPSGYVRMSIYPKMHLHLYQSDFLVDFQNQWFFF